MGDQPRWTVRRGSRRQSAEPELAAATAVTVYEVRFRPGPKDAADLAVVAWFGGVGVWFLNQAPLIASAIIFVASCLLLARIYAAVVQWGKPALRIDRQGIRFGRLAFYGRQSARFIPWDELGSIVLFRRQIWHSRRRYLGLDGRGQPIPVPELPGLGLLLPRRVSHVPPGVVATSRPVVGWTLDQDELQRMLTLHAPHVQLVDLG